MTTPRATHTYGYNDIYELTSSRVRSNLPHTDIHDGIPHDFTYDNVGNRIDVDGTTYVPNELNQYESVGGVTYSYDPNGNLTNDGTNTYTYDVENRMITATTPSSTLAFEYDGFGRRISKAVDGVTTYFIYDGDQVIEERDVSGQLFAQYVYGSGIDEVLTMTRDSETYYYFYDGLGSVTDITDSTGSTVETYTYDVYGQPSQLSSIGNPYYFTGRRFDEETGLYYYRVRYYSPEIGRFLQRDPIGYYDSMNLYEYCWNNSINWVDPWGLCKGDVDKDNKEDVIPQNSKPPSIPTGGPPYPDEFTRDAKWWEWIIWLIWKAAHAFKFSPGISPFTPDFGPVPPHHRDWPGMRRQRPEDYII